MDLSLSHLNGRRTTIGETAGTALAPPGGWVLGPDGTATPAYLNPQPPPRGWRPSSSPGHVPAQPSYSPRGTSGYPGAASRGRTEPVQGSLSTRPLPAVHPGTRTRQVVRARPVRQVPLARDGYYRDFSRKTLLLGVVILLVGVAGCAIGYYWEANYPSQSYPKMAGYVLFGSLVVALVGFATVVCNRPRRYKRYQLSALIVMAAIPVWSRAPLSGVAARAAGSIRWHRFVLSGLGQHSQIGRAR